MCILNMHVCVYIYSGTHCPGVMHVTRGVTRALIDKSDTYIHRLAK